MTELHRMPLESGMWWACAEPERPGDGQTAYDRRCPRCVVKLRVEVRQRGDHLLLRHGEDGLPSCWAQASEILAEIET